MPIDSSVVADPATGAAFVAGTRIAMSAADAKGGALRFGGPRGSVLRPLAFGERTQLVTAASMLPAPADAVAAAILRAATVEDAADATPLLEVLAMWLAGAEWDAPDFTETTLLVARAAGWPPDELFAAPAREVDRLAVHLDEQRRESEWKSLVFAEAAAETIEDVRARFANRLLQRSGAAVVVREETAARSRESTTREATAGEHAPAASLGRVRLIAPRDGGVDAVRFPARGASASTTHHGAAVAQQRPAIAFSIRQPRPRGGGVATAQPMAAQREAIEGAPVAAVQHEAIGAAAAVAANHPPIEIPRPAARHEVLRELGERRGRAGTSERELVEADGGPRVWSLAGVARTSTLAAVPQEKRELRFEQRKRMDPVDAESLAALLDDEADLRGVDR